jgi:hypothetical protein
MKNNQPWVIERVAEMFMGLEKEAVGEAKCAYKFSPCRLQRLPGGQSTLLDAKISELERKEYQPRSPCKLC